MKFVFDKEAEGGADIHCFRKKKRIEEEIKNIEIELENLIQKHKDFSEELQRRKSQNDSNVCAARVIKGCAASNTKRSQEAGAVKSKARFKASTFNKP